MAEAIPVRLADHWLIYLEGLVQSQRFDSLDEAIESGIRLLEADQNTEDRLARLLEEGENDGGFEEWDYDRFRADMRQRDRKAA